jgi:hypothetical protein
LRRFATALAVLGAVALGAAFVLASSDVPAAPDVHCASAWRAAPGSLTFTGERSAAEVTLLHASCERAGVASMRRAYTAAAAGGIALAAAVTLRRRRATPPGPGPAAARRASG